ncbi:MAG: hypothetical protein LBF26_03155 [Puniceicoccales bacterium]|jgi:hypothetical protein|nr:hypothetical protein [Puniceicoccales bacterium]
MLRVSSGRSAVVPVVSVDDLEKADAILYGEFVRRSQELRTCPVCKRKDQQNKVTEALRMRQYAALLLACYHDLCSCAALSSFVSAVNDFGAVEDDEVKKAGKWNRVCEARNDIIVIHSKLLLGAPSQQHARDDGEDEQMRQIDEQIRQINADTSDIEAGIADINVESAARVERIVARSKQLSADAEIAEARVREINAEPRPSTEGLKTKAIADAKAKTALARAERGKEPLYGGGQNMSGKFIFLWCFDRVRNFFTAIFRWCFSR